MSILRRLAAAAIVAIALAAPQAVSALTIGFSFTNSPNNGGGVVTGVIEGLADNETRAATSFRVISNTGPGNFGIGEYIGIPNSNSFTLSNGNVTLADFSSFGFNNTLPGVTTASIEILFVPGFARASGLTNLSDGVIRLSSDLSFSVIPLPPAILMLASGIGALAALRGAARRRAAA